MTEGAREGPDRGRRRRERGDRARHPAGLAHNDWGLPLVGGLAGGYALSSMMHQREARPVYEQPVYAAPAPTYVAPAAPAYVAPAAPAAPSAATIEHQLNVLDQLAAKGYITQSEYQARRQALLESNSRSGGEPASGGRARSRPQRRRRSV